MLFIADVTALCFCNALVVKLSLCGKCGGVCAGACARGRVALHHPCLHQHMVGTFLGDLLCMFSDICPPPHPTELGASSTFSVLPPGTYVMGSCEGQLAAEVSAQIPHARPPHWNHFLKLWSVILMGWLEHPNPSSPEQRRN